VGRENRDVGIQGENRAVKFLESNGYRIVERNFHTPFGEIDAVARHGGFIVFVEIKTRASSSFGPPLLNVTRSKQRHLVKNALCYLAARSLVHSDWRIDVVSVKLNERYEVESIELIENAVTGDT